MSLRVLSRGHALQASPALRALAASSTGLERRRLIPSSTTVLPLLAALPTTQTRAKWSLNRLNPFRRKRGDDAMAPDAGLAANQQLDNPDVRRETVKTMSSTLTRSIFEDEVASTAEAVGGPDGPAAIATSAEAALLTTDPDPRSRVRWERKKVVQLVRRNGRASRAERIARAERQLVLRSPWMATSTKKLMHLARQVGGRTVDDALVQMRYSKKKFAAEVRHHLEAARDNAVVARGMGLGAVNGEAAAAAPRKIQTKDGKWLTVDDPTRMYVAQAWVNRGPLRGVTIDYKGRGRFGKLKHRTTSLSLVLKEEKTRIREYDERKAKEAKRKPWVHLPNRPVSAQRPYYSW